MTTDLKVTQEELDAAFDAKAYADEVVEALEAATVERLSLDREGYPACDADCIEVECHASWLLPVYVERTVGGSHCGCDFEAAVEWRLRSAERRRKDGRLLVTYGVNVNV